MILPVVVFPLVPVISITLSFPKAGEYSGHIRAASLPGRVVPPLPIIRRNQIRNLRQSSQQ